jgi:Flp pilus assembly protein TadG
MTTVKHLSGLLRRDGLPSQRGQDLAEGAIVLPILTLLILAIIQSGILVFNYNTISNMAREGARYGSIHPADEGPSACPGTLPTTATSIVTAACYTGVGLDPANVTVRATRVNRGSQGCVGPAGCVRVTITYNAQLFFMPDGVGSALSLTSSSIMERER